MKNRKLDTIEDVQRLIDGLKQKLEASGYDLEALAKSLTDDDPLNAALAAEDAKRERQLDERLARIEEMLAKIKADRGV